MVLFLFPLIGCLGALSISFDGYVGAHKLLMHSKHLTHTKTIPNVLWSTDGIRLQFDLALKMDCATFSGSHRVCKGIQTCCWGWGNALLLRVMDEALEHHRQPEGVLFSNA